MPSFNRSMHLGLVFIGLSFLASSGSWAAVSHGTTPDAQNDDVETNDVTPITIDLLANDSDPDGELLTIVPGSVSCDGSPATLIDYQDGTVGLPAMPGFCGFCTFDYDLKDPGNLSDSATVMVAVSLADGTCDPNVPCPLSVASLPPTHSFTAGQPATLAATVSGDDAQTTYRWSKDGIPITVPPTNVSGETTPSLQFSPIGPADAGSYELVATQPGACQRSSGTTDVSTVEDTSEEVFDDFLLNGIDRVWGAPLDGTLTELGGRRWTAHNEVVFGSGFIQIEETAPAGNRSAGFSFDPAGFPGRPVITLTAQVHGNQEGVWAAIGLAQGPTMGLFGQGLVWMRLSSAGGYAVRTRGTTDAPLAFGTYDDLDVEFGALVKLEIDLAAGTVSAWIDDDQILYRSYLPADWPTWLTASHVSLQIHQVEEGLGAPMTFGHIRAIATADGSQNQAPFLDLPAAIPGTLEGWHFDLGGEGIAYHDVDATNTGNVERASGGIEGTDLWQAQGSSVVQVQSFAGNEWLEYSVTSAGGDFQAALEVAATGTGGTVGISIGTGPLLGGPWTVPGTGGNVTTVVGTEPVALPSSGLGTVPLRVRVLSGELELRRLHLTPWAQPIELDDDVVVLTAPLGTEAIDFPLSELLAGDEPVGDVVITAIPLPWVRLNGNGTATYFPGLRGFFSRGWDRFTYLAAHVDDPTLTAEATVTLLAGGLITGDDHAVTLCPAGGGAAGTLFIPFADLLANDTPFNPALVAITDVAQQPTGGVGTVTVEMTNQRFVFTPTTAFCTTATLPSFRYRSVLLEDPTITTTGTVWLHGNNPVVALDDTLDFVFSSLTGELAIFHGQVLANDQPENLSILGDIVGPSAFGATFFFGLDLTRMTPDPGFWARGYDLVDYTAELTAGLDDDAQILVRAVPKAAPDTVLVPFEPGAGTLTLDGDAILANDGPHLVPPVIDIFAATDGALGTLDAFAGDLLYTPTDAFWQAGVDNASYDVWFLDSSRAAASASISLIAEPAFRTVDNAFKLVFAGEDYFQFFNFQLSDDDPPLTLVVFDSIDTVTQFGGTIEDPGCNIMTSCDRLWYTPPAGGLPNGFDRASYRIRLADVPAETRSGYVYFFEGAVPTLAGTDDALMVDADAATDILFTTLSANDTGTALGVELVQAPIHGSLTESTDRFTYTPTPGYVGADFFRYAAVEGATGRLSAPVTVAITVDRVLVPADDTFLVEPDTPGQALPVAALLANDMGAPGALSFEGAGVPLNGSLLDLGDELVYQPDPQAFLTAGSDRFTYSVSLVEHPGTQDRGTVHLEADLGCSGAFTDNFESADTSAWDLISEVGGTLVVDEASALEGQYGLAATIHEGATNVFVHHNTAQSEVHFRSELRFDSDGLTMPNGGRFVFVNARSPSVGAAYHLELDQDKGQRRFRIKALLDDGSQTLSDWIPLAPGAHGIIVEWWASAAPELDDGGVRLFLDRQLVASLSGLDNDQRRIEQVRLGAIFGIDPGTAGPLRIDDYRSCRGDRTPVPISDDDFEDGDLVGWDGVSAVGGGTMAPTAAAALEGQIGLEATLVPATQALYLTDSRPTDESHYWASFRFDPDGLPLDRGDSIRIMTGEAAGSTPFILYYGRGNGGYRMLVGAQRDDGTFTFGPWVPTSGEPIDLLVEWRASTGAGVGISGSPPDGLTRLWIDGVLLVDMQGLDNDSKRIDRIRLGARNGLPSGPGGSIYFDDFRSWSTP